MVLNKSLLFTTLVFNLCLLLVWTSATTAQNPDAAWQAESVEHVPFGIESPVGKWVMPQKGMQVSKYDGTVELLPLLNLDLDTDRGKFEFQNNELVVKTSEFSRLALPVLALGTYSITTTYRTGETKPEIRISVPIASLGMATVAIGYNDGNGVGIDGFKGEGIGHSKEYAVPDWSFEPNSEYVTWIKVEWKSKNRIRLQVYINEKKVLDRTALRTDFKSSDPLDQHVHPSVPIMLAKTDSEIRFRKIDFRKIIGHTLMSRPLTKSQVASEGDFGVKFDGSSTNALSRNFHFDGRSPLTFESWVIPYNKENGHLFTAGWHEGYGWLGLSVQRGKWRFNAFHKSYGIREPAVSNEKIEWGKLIHVAAIFNINRMSIFVNGHQVASSKRFNSHNYKPSGCYLRLGRGMDTKSDKFFSGIVDQFRVSKGIRYSGDFSPEKKLAVDERTLLLYDFDEAHGNVFRDQSEFGLHSVCSGTVERVRIRK